MTAGKFKKLLVSQGFGNNIEAFFTEMIDEGCRDIFAATKKMKEDYDRWIMIMPNADRVIIGNKAIEVIEQIEIKLQEWFGGESK